MAALGYTPVNSNTLLDFGDNVLVRNDDGSSFEIDITAIFEEGIEIGGQTFGSLYLNNNGNITFGAPLSGFTPGIIGAETGLNIIAPYWADVDTRADVPDLNDGVFWDFDNERDSIVFTWNQIGYYLYHIDKLSTFQLELRDRGPGNVEIIFRYADVEWTTGDYSGGEAGLGGTVARAGFTLGEVYFELPASGNQANMLALEDQAGNLGVAGVWQFLLLDGSPSGFGTIQGDNFTGTAKQDIWFGLKGNDIAHGMGAGDVLYGNAGADRLYGDAGADRLYGDTGNDRLYGGTGNDMLNGGAGNDLLDGGSGRDSAEFLSSAEQAMVVRLDRGTATGMGDDTLVSIENATTGEGADRLYGSAANNVLIGNGGKDRLYGNGGNDRLIGGAGNDRLTGGAGADRFVFQEGGGTDTVVDFQNGIDKFEILSGAGRFSDITVTDVGANVRITFADVTIILQNVPHTAIGASDFIFDLV